MSVLDHVEVKVKVWDGAAFSMVTPAEAKKLVKAGTHQDTTNISAMQLKRPHEFRTAAVKAEPSLPPGVKAEPKSKRKEYKTRQMKAET